MKLIYCRVLASESSQVKSLAIEKIVFKCKIRLREQAIRLNNRLQFVYEHDHDRYIHSRIQARSFVDESLQNIEYLD